MNINKYNAERYPDPTAYEALMDIMRNETKQSKKQKNSNQAAVFICSPYAGNIPENTRKACRYCRFAVERNRIPFAPHLLFPQFLDESYPEQRTLGIQMGLAFLEKCREVWVFGNITTGMRMEIERAGKRRIPVRYFNENCEEVPSCVT